MSTIGDSDGGGGILFEVGGGGFLFRHDNSDAMASKRDGGGRGAVTAVATLREKRTAHNPQSLTSSTIEGEEDVHIRMNDADDNDLSFSRGFAIFYTISFARMTLCSV